MGAICHHHRNIFSFYNLLSCVSNKSGLSNKSAQLSRKTSASKLCPTPKSVRWIFGLRNQCECVSGKELFVTVSFSSVALKTLFCFRSHDHSLTVFRDLNVHRPWRLLMFASCSISLYTARFVMLVPSWALMWAKSLILPQCVTALTPRHPRTHQ